MLKIEHFLNAIFCANRSLDRIKGIGLTKKTLANAWVDKSSLSVELRRSFLNLSFVPGFRGNLDV